MLTNSSTHRRGIGNSRRAVKTLNPALVYDYALRCAILACLEYQQQQKSTTAAAARNLGDKSANRHSVHLSGVTEMFSTFTDKIVGDESNGDKVPKAAISGLMRRLDNIADGRDSAKLEYRDSSFLKILGQVKETLKSHRFRSQLKVNGLVILFLQKSEEELKKRDPNPAVWFERLDRFVIIFTEIFLHTLEEDAPSAISTETIEKLRSSIIPKSEQKKQDRRNPAVNSNNSSTDIFELIENFPMVKTVKDLFHIENSIHKQKIRELQPLCTESNYFLDLKTLINAVNQNLPFPGRKEDFANETAYNSWLPREKKYLNSMMTYMVSISSASLVIGSEQDVGSSNLLSGRRPNENLSKRSSIYGSLGAASGDDNPYTFIPTDPRSYFRFLMNMCMDLDTTVTPDTERAKMSVLSQSSEDLLKQCSSIWRLSSPYKVVLYLEMVKGRIDADDELPVEEVILEARDAMRSVEKSLKENEISNWTINDRENLIRVFEGLNETCLRSLNESFSQYWMVSPELVKEQIELLSNIYENPTYLEDHPDPFQYLLLLEDTVAGAAVSRWRVLEKSCLSSKCDDMTNLMNLADKLIKELSSVSKKFKKPLKGSLHIPGIVMARQMSFFVLEMENWAFLPETKKTPINIVFELYDKVLTLKRLYDQYGPRQKSALFKVESWFLLHVKRWLQTTNEETPKWVKNAISQDKFEPINETTLHSSSVVDLFTMFHQSVEFVQRLEWPNSIQDCRFNTTLSKVIGVALEQYIFELEEKISEDIYPGSREQSGPKTNENFLHKFVSSRGHAKHIEVKPSNFFVETCIKVNDIEAARTKLDRLYQNMDVDDIAQEMREYEQTHMNNALAKKTADQNTKCVYSIKFVRAEGLPPSDSNGLSDPYVVLEIDDKPIIKTKTVYETLNPRWDQVFDLELTGEADVLAIVYDEDRINDEEIGGVWFKLKPAFYGDFQTHEIPLDIKPQGKLHLRISMEGEKDDIHFWFGKAFRSLKRAENDSAGLIVDKMGAYFRKILSRKTLKKLLEKDKPSFFASFSRTSNHSDSTLSLEECEGSLLSLIDYLEQNLKLLNDNLSETNMQLVVLRIWREILISLESVLLPPLSEQQSDYKPLDDYEFHIVYKWLELLKILFNGGEDGDAVPLDKLENSQYYALLAINAAYTLSTHKLIEGYNTVVKNQLEMKLRGGRKADRSKTVYHSKNTAQKRKVSARKSASIEMPNSDTILRILRMHDDKEARDFLHAEFERRNNPIFENLGEEKREEDEMPMFATVIKDTPPVPGTK